MFKIIEKIKYNIELKKVRSEYIDKKVEVLICCIDDIVSTIELSKYKEWEKSNKTCCECGSKKIRRNLIAQYRYTSNSYEGICNSCGNVQIYNNWRSYGYSDFLEDLINPNYFTIEKALAEANRKLKEFEIEKEIYNNEYSYKISRIPKECYSDFTSIKDYNLEELKEKLKQLNKKA